MHRRWRSRWVGAVSASLLGTAVMRRHNHFDFGMTVSDRSIDAILIVGSVSSE
jgi:hypothetical protein